MAFLAQNPLLLAAGIHPNLFRFWNDDQTGANAAKFFLLGVKKAVAPESDNIAIPYKRIRLRAVRESDRFCGVKEVGNLDFPATGFTGSNRQPTFPEWVSDGNEIAQHLSVAS